MPVLLSDVLPALPSALLSTLPSSSLVAFSSALLLALLRDVFAGAGAAPSLAPQLVQKLASSGILAPHLGQNIFCLLSHFYQYNEALRAAMSIGQAKFQACRRQVTAGIYQILTW